jgi:hypothetical protein
MTEILEQIIASGMASGEFSVRDATFATRLINTACIRFRDPRLIVEHEQEPEPSPSKLGTLKLRQSERCSANRVTKS